MVTVKDAAFLIVYLHGNWKDTTISFACHESSNMHKLPLEVAQ